VNPPRTARDRIDRVLAILRRTRRFIAPALVLALLGGSATVSFALLRKRVFKSETLIFYREGIRTTDLVGGEDQGDRAQKLGLRLKEMVLSRSRLEQIVTSSKLYPEVVEERGMIDAVDEMRRHIAFRVQDGDVFGLSFDGNDPEHVRLVTAKLADALISENTRSNSEQAVVTRDVLDREKERVDKELKERERALAQFLSKHPEFARETAQPGASIRAINSARAAATTQRNDATLASLEREAQRLQDRLNTPVTHKRKDEPQADPQLVAAKQEAEAEAAQAQKELTDKQGEFTEEHPDVRAARVRVKETQDKLKRASDAVAFSLAAQQQKSVAKEEDEGYIDRGALENLLKRINEEITDFKRRKADAPAPTTVVATSVMALETDWTRLNRDVVDERERMQSLQEKESQVSLAESATATGHTAQMVVIDPAFVPTHAAPPGRTQVMVSGLAATAVLSLLLALGLALLDDRVYDRVDIERLGILPLLGVVPRAGNDKKVKRG
jgi:protein tyrosine kinase modulator